MARSVSAGMASLLAADAGTLAPVTNPIKLALVIENFTPSPDLVAGDLVLGAELGLEPIEGVVGPQNESIDPSTGENLVEVKEPVGGFRWETDPEFIGPVTVWGYALLSNNLVTLWATEKLINPVQLIAPNQAHNAPAMSIRFDGNKVH